MHKTQIIGVLLIIMVLVLGACGPTTTTTTPPATTTPLGTSNEVVTYNIEAIEDVTFGATVRKVARVSMVSGMTKADIEWIAQDVVEQITSQQPVNAVGIFIYHNGDNYFGSARISVDWTRANEVTTGDYSNHQYHYMALDSQYGFWG